MLSERRRHKDWRKNLTFKEKYVFLHWLKNYTLNYGRKDRRVVETAYWQ